MKRIYDKYYKVTLVTSFVFVETANGGKNWRGKVVKAAQYKPGEKECYASVYLHNEDFKRYVEDPNTGSGRGSCKGYSGPVLPTKAHFDIDRADNLATALEDTQALLERITGSYHVPKEAVCIFFSGSKGFHIEIPAECFGGFEASVEVSSKIKALAKKVAGDVELDDAIYDRNRLWRCPNTINSKTGLYKIPLTYDELRKLSIEEIKDLAQGPREIPDPNGSLGPVPSLVSLKNSALKKPQGVILKDNTQNYTAAHVDPLAAKIAEYMPLVGRRHVYARRCIGFLLPKIGKDRTRTTVFKAWEGFMFEDTAEKLEALIESTGTKCANGDQYDGGGKLEETVPGLVGELDQLLQPTPEEIEEQERQDYTPG